MPGKNEEVTNEALASELYNLKGQFTTFAEHFDEFKKEMRSAFKEAQGHKPSFLSLMGVIAAVLVPTLMFVGMVGAVALFVINSQTDAKLAPVLLAQGTSSVKQAAEDERMKNLDAMASDITNLKSTATSNYETIYQERLHLDKSDVRLEEIEKSLSSMATKFTEVETQFHAQDELENSRYANQERAYAVLYEKVFGVVYPIFPYYFPKVGGVGSSGAAGGAQ